MRRVRCQRWSGRNWAQEVERLREELERTRANRDRWRKRAETAEARLGELEAGDG